MLLIENRFDSFLKFVKKWFNLLSEWYLEMWKHQYGNVSKYVNKGTKKYFKMLSWKVKQGISENIKIVAHSTGMEVSISQFIK